MNKFYALNKHDIVNCKFTNDIKTLSKSRRIFQEGSIGHDLVIKPLPKRFSTKLHNKKEYNTSDLNDDEMFLDADGDLSSEVSIDTGLPIKRKSKGYQHIVYKRDREEEDEFLSDYGD